MIINLQERFLEKKLEEQLIRLNEIRGMCVEAIDIVDEIMADLGLEEDLGSD